MKKDIERICKNCESWDIFDCGYDDLISGSSRECNAVEIGFDVSMVGNHRLNYLFADVFQEDDVPILTGPNFGCIHFKARL